MITKLRYADIMALRDQYERERRRKRVQIAPSLKILTHALPKFEPFESHFVSSGNWHNLYAVRIEGGPDHDKIVILRPWRPAALLEQLASYEGETAINYAARPLIERATLGSLHAVTVSFLAAKLIEMRMHDMGEHICSLHRQLGD